MIEAYAFLAAFALQILVMSVLQPLWTSRYVLTQVNRLPAERLSGLNPAIDVLGTTERHLARYRLVNSAIALLGLVTLAWLSNYLRGADWDDGPVEALAAAYFLLQVLPMFVFALTAARYRRLLLPLLDRKRTATLQRRRLFDFVSPLAVIVALASYVFFAGYVALIARDPFPGFQGRTTLAGVTLLYLLLGASVYWQLYGRNANPLESRAGRVRAIGLGVKACVYGCTAAVVFLAVNFTLVRLELERWEPFAQSVFFVLTMVLSFMAYVAPPRHPEARELDPGAVG